jgi:hypothetical protein
MALSFDFEDQAAVAIDLDHAAGDRDTGRVVQHIDELTA